MIASEQLLHNGCPERCGRPDGKRVAHWSSIEISRPNGDRVFFVEANSPRVPEAAAGSGLCRHAFFEGERRTQPETFLTRVVIAQNIGDNRCRLSRGDARERLT